MTPLPFLFDFISPYAYLAWRSLPALQAQHGVRFDPVPVLFAGLLQAHGNVGPAEIPAKRRAVFRDVLWRARKMGIPLVPPPAHPFRPLLSLRVCCVPGPPAERWRRVDALMDATWAGGPGVTDPETVASALSAAGLDGPGLVGASQDPEVKARLRQNTDQAIVDGVFGVPTIRRNDALYWGHDSLERLGEDLAGAAPLDPALLAQWDAVRPSAERRR